ncbi:MAG: uncharacterized protein KVP18_000958 [Porospora cf. gigantea A]|nr:MAG: hypothetical protein KVP18_000958 [Porospora cf. gigantea A]
MHDPPMILATLRESDILSGHPQPTEEDLNGDCDLLTPLDSVRLKPRMEQNIVGLDWECLATSRQVFRSTSVSSGCDDCVSKPLLACSPSTLSTSSSFPLSSFQVSPDIVLPSNGARARKKKQAQGIML